MNRQLIQNHSLVLIDDLVEDVCWHLVAHAEVARIGFVLDGRSWILPVNHRVVEDTIVFRTASDSMLHSLSGGEPVVVEFDRMDERRMTGWSVLIHGTAEEVPEEMLPTLEGLVHPWAPGDKDRWMRVVAHTISGRSISRPEPPPPFRLPYMPLD
jgi:nitroimidazol reductase NimA-like FMN-containing flavoprotein (pyridoxamine 5'-phosphate oxidase superfamily)